MIAATQPTPARGRADKGVEAMRADIDERAQRAIANAVVAMVHGEDAARHAERAGEALFSEDIAELDESTLLQVVGDAPTSTWARSEFIEGADPVELLVRCQLAKSKAEARRFLEQGGVYVNNIRSAGESIGINRLLHDRYLVLRRGRREMHLVVVA